MQGGLNEAKSLKNLPKFFLSLQILNQHYSDKLNAALLKLWLSNFLSDELSHAGLFLWGLGKEGRQPSMVIEAEQHFVEVVSKQQDETRVQLLGTVHIDFLPQICEVLHQKDGDWRELAGQYPQRAVEATLYGFSKTEFFLESYLSTVRDVLREYSDAIPESLISLETSHPKQAQKLIEKISNCTEIILAQEVMGIVLSAAQAKDPQCCNRLKNYIPSNLRELMGVPLAPSTTGQSHFSSSSSSSASSTSTLASIALPGQTPLPLP